MTRNTLIYKATGPRPKVAPQIILILVAVLIFYQSICMQDASFNANHIIFNSTSTWPLLIKTLGYILMLIPAGIIATNWSAKKLLCLSIGGIGLMHLIVAFLVSSIVRAKSGTWLIDCGILCANFLLGVIQAPVLPCVYALLGRLVSPCYRVTAGSIVFSAKYYNEIFGLGIAYFASIDSFGTVDGRAHLTFGLFAVIWCVLYHFSGSPMNDLEFVGQAESFKPNIPWSSMVSSLPVWTLIVSHAANLVIEANGQRTLSHPTYLYGLRSALDKAVSSALPLSMIMVASIGLAALSDAFVARRLLTRLAARKIFNSLATCIPMAMHMVIVFAIQRYYRDQHQYYFVFDFVFLILVTLTSLQSSGFLINHMDLSPYYAGILIAVTEVANQVMKLVVSVIVNYCVAGVAKEVVLIVLCALPVLAGIFFAICGKASIQDKWSPVPFYYRNPDKLDA